MKTFHITTAALAVMLIATPTDTHADLIEQDFQDYFDALTDFSICHDQVFARTVQEAREVSAVYHSFLERAAAAGAVIVPRHAPGSSPSIQRPETGHHDSR